MELPAPAWPTLNAGALAYCDGGLGSML